MSNFPGSPDDDVSLPRVDDNLSDIGGEAINALRDAVFSIETELGIGASGSVGSVADRLGISIQNDGYIKPSALTGIGLVSLPITDVQISPTAAIQESKINLAHTTTSLYTLYLNLKNAIDIVNGFISLTGVKLDPHITGSAYNHLLQHIKIDPTSTYKNRFLLNRDTTNANTLELDISNDLSNHERLDGTVPGTLDTYTTLGGEIVPSEFAHTGSGVYINPSAFSTIPQSNDSLQKFAEYVDSSSLLLIGGRIQNLYANGIPRSSRSESLTLDGYAELVVSPTPATAYLLGVPPGPQSNSPVDDINGGDDVILFNPTSGVLANNTFDAQFSQVKPGDIITINYGNGIAAKFTIDSIKTVINGSTRVYAVRINSRNLYSSTTATARIDRALFHTSKYGVLSSSRSAVLNNLGQNAIGQYETLTTANPKGAVALGAGFTPSEIDNNHYNLYLTLYPTGKPSDVVQQLPPIDITGNKGTTPGEYTLDTVINTVNLAFRASGYNYRFSAFSYSGQFGIMLADPYNNASFSIVSGSVDGYGNYTSSSTSQFGQNVIDNFNGLDPLGFGIVGSNSASPPYSVAYSTPLAANVSPTLIFYPLRKNFFYTNGVERDTLKSDPNTVSQIIDTFGDGYWPATITSISVLGTNVSATYTVNLDLTKTSLSKGKTLVVQPAFATTDPRYNTRDYGRFVIQNISFAGCAGPTPFTTITVYDCVHGVGFSPAATSTNIPVRLYFSDDSVAFDAQNVFDQNSAGPFKRFFEVYVDQNGHTFTHERARFIKSGSDISNINLYNVSTKLRGYPTNSDNEIRLTISSYDETTGMFTGNLARFIPSGPSTSNLGPTITGKKGEIVRFFDETNIDYIDFVFNPNDTISPFTNKSIDIQLFKSLQFDKEYMIISSCQMDDTSKLISYLKDERQFGNISESEFSSSAIDFISAPQRLLNENGVINGFDIVSGTATNIVSLTGGSAVVNGKIVLINNSVVKIPALQEVLAPGFSTTINNITWFICANSKSELELVASTDYDTSLSATYGSLDHNRIFYVKNPNLSSSTPYAIRGTYLNNLLSSYKGITPLYIVNATTAFGTSWTITSAPTTDARRFVSRGYTGLANALVLGSNANFHSLSAIDAWLSQFTNFVSNSTIKTNTFGSNVILKGLTTQSSSITLNYAHPTIFEGDDAELDFTGTTLTLSNNITFKNLTIKISSSSTVVLGTNITFDNCTITASSATAFTLGNNTTFRNCNISYAYDATSDGSFSSSNLVNSAKACLFKSGSISNIKVIGCTFTSSNQNRFPFISAILPASSSYAENIDISNNTFQTTATADDKLAIIAFSGPTVASTLITGPRLTDCNISNNFCNKNQLISISSSLSGSNLNDMIVPINVIISDNVCGAINFLVKEDVQYSVYNTSTIKDKSNSLTIERNVCRFIYSGIGSGSIIATSSNRVYQGTSIVNGIFSASISILNNKTSWIHIGIRASSNYGKRIPTITINGNSLTAHDTAFLASYYGIVSPPNSALIVDRITGV